METETAPPFVHPTQPWLTWCDECQCHTADADTHQPQCVACGANR